MSNDGNGGMGVSGNYFTPFSRKDIDKVKSGVQGYLSTLPGNIDRTKDKKHQEMKILRFIDQIASDKKLDENSRSLLLGQFTSMEGTGINDPLLSLDKKLNSIRKEYSNAASSTDAAFKSRVATQKMYETMIDQPGAKQTRADMSLLLSNTMKR